MPETSRSFAAASSAVREARAYLRSTLREWSASGYEFGAPLVLTELVTNAVLHARTPYEVLLSVRSDALLIEVRDFDGRAPRPRHYGVDATTGRGMSMIDSLCREWGVRSTDGGKVVWALVWPDDRASLDLPDDEEPGLRDARGEVTGRTGPGEPASNRAVSNRAVSNRAVSNRAATGQIRRAA